MLYFDLILFHLIHKYINFYFNQQINFLYSRIIPYSCSIIYKYDTFLASILKFNHNRHIVSIYNLNIYQHHKITFLHKKQIYNKSCEKFLSNRSSLVKTYWPSEFLEKKSIYRYRQNLKQNAEWDISKEKGKRWSEVRNDRRNVRRK